jgi:hypothetical protein
LKAESLQSAVIMSLQALGLESVKSAYSPQAASILIFWYRFIRGRAIVDERFDAARNTLRVLERLRYLHALQQTESL